MQFSVSKLLNTVWPYVGVSNFFFGGGDQLPIPTRNKMSVWGDQPPHTLNFWPGGTSPPPSPPHAHVWVWLLLSVPNGKIEYLTA